MIYSFFSYGTDHSTTLLNIVNCFHDDYLNILQCSYSTIIDSKCTDLYDATVYCCEFNSNSKDNISIMQILLEYGIV